VIHWFVKAILILQSYTASFLDEVVVYVLTVTNCYVAPHKVPHDSSDFSFHVKINPVSNRSEKTP